MKRVTAIHQSPEQHWVGDGFPVRSLFSYHAGGALLSPFLLLDHAGPAEFEPAAKPRGVGEHPHRGFETVTIVYQGEVEHRDTAGNGGSIGPGDVQWMTAASGLMHEEFHSREFARRGGTRLTLLGEELMRRYRRIETAAAQANADDLAALMRLLR